MTPINDILDCIREMAPESLAEPWDNCGLLISGGAGYIDSAIVCLDVTRRVIDAAVGSDAKLVISHHPLIFQALKRIKDDSELGRLIRAAIKNDIAIYAAHTNADKAYGGLNDLLAGIVGLEVDYPEGDSSAPGYYRIGNLPHEMSADDFNEHVRLRLKLKNIGVPNGHAADRAKNDAPKNGGNGGNGKFIKRVAVICGAYDHDIAQTVASNADALLCGEIRYHEALDLAGAGVHVVQAGHFETERFFMSLIEKWIKEKFPDFAVECIGFSEPPTICFDGGNGGRE